MKREPDLDIAPPPFNALQRVIIDEIKEHGQMTIDVHKHPELYAAARDLAYWAIVRPHWFSNQQGRKLVTVRKHPLHTWDVDEDGK